MTIGHTPIRERLVIHKRGPLAAVLTGTSAFPASTTAALYFYTEDDVELAFWPLAVNGDDIIIDIANQDLAAIPTRSKFTIYVTYPTAPEKEWPWYEGPVLRI